MEFHLTTVQCLCGCIAALGGTLWYSCRRGTITVGLPLSYLLSLGLIHLTGAWVYTLSWFSGEGSELVRLGLQECLLGVLAFVFGALGMERIITRNRRKTKVPAGTPRTPEAEIKKQEALERLRQPRQARRYVSWLKRKKTVPTEQVERRVAKNVPSRLPKVYMLLGLLFIVILIPILRTIPSIGAVAVCGANLLVTGSFLICWHHWNAGHRTRMILWLAPTLGFPLFTMLVLGFIGMGALATMVVVSCVMTFYRPRWQVFLALLTLLYVGLSVYVTYMRDRSDFREIVSGRESYPARVKKLADIFSSFEWFNSRNERHLELLSERLNQNILVGAAVVYLREGGANYAKGRTLVEAVLALVPRIIWPDKPVRAGSPDVVSHYTGMQFAEGTSVGVGQIMEFYINFGSWGVVLGLLGFGFVVRWADWQAAEALHRGDGRRFVSWFLPGLALLQTGGSLVEVFGTVAASTVLVLAVNGVIITDSLAGMELPLSKRRGPRHRSGSPVTPPAETSGTRPDGVRAP